MRDDLLAVENLTYCFRYGKHIAIQAVDNLSFQVREGEILGLVGESGSGKSTTARCIMNIYRPGSGRILYQGIDVWNPKEFRRHKRLLQTSRQFIFQDSSSSLNPKQTVEQIIAEPLKIHGQKPERGTFRGEAAFQLNQVGLGEECLDQYPNQLSGGMRQRVAIARALTMKPRLLVADEPIASLDVSIQAQMINLLKRLQKEHGFSMLFIAHDLAVVHYLCDRVGVMYQGKLLELGPVTEVFENPCHIYTKSLIGAIPIPDPRLERARVLPEFEKENLEWRGQKTEVSFGHFVWR